MLNVGERIRGIRKAKGVTSAHLANQIGVSQSFVSGIENGSKKCSLETLSSICAALNVSLADFFAAEAPNVDPSLISLLQAAERLTEEEREYLTKFIQARKDD